MQLRSRESGFGIIVVDSVKNKSTDKLEAILRKYSELPQYSGMDIPEVHAKCSYDGYPIHIAATRGSISEISTLLDHGADINAKTEFSGYTPLHNAVEREHLDAVKFLVDHGADINAKRELDGYTPLHNAVARGHLDAVKFLVGHGASITIKTTDGATPIELAKQLGERHEQDTAKLVEIHHFLSSPTAFVVDSVKNQSNNQSTDKLEAILREYSELMDIPILEVNTKSLFNDYPIHIAAVRGSISEISTLLAHGADVNAKGEEGYTPLHNAVGQVHLDAVKFLVGHGASITIKTTDGATPIELAKILSECSEQDAAKLVEVHRFLSSLTGLP